MMGIKDLEGRLADATGLSSAPQIEPVPVSPVRASIPSAGLPYCSAMCSIMLVGEEECGRKAVWPHHKRLPAWFNPADWACWPVLSYDKRELHIVAVYSARKGALRRLIDGAARAGLSPVIVGPMGPVMPALLRKWGWRETIVGEGWDTRDEWRPASGIAAVAAGETVGLDRRQEPDPQGDAQTPGSSS